MDPSDHLFRRESGRMIAALTRIFGVHNLALAEDVVQDAFCRAMEVWKFRGVPENPSAWLMATAKNRAIDILRRERTARTYAPELGRLLETEWTLAPVITEIFRASVIKDDQLRMMFTCCHPRLPEVAQIMLILRLLCGFGVGEIAGAFLISESAVEKRITRAKKVLAGTQTLFDLADADLPRRLTSVHQALYLLFNEGYHGASPEASVRKELCDESMRLAALLCEHPLTARPATFALAALMCLNAARLPARVDASGNLSSLVEQDRSLWDSALVQDGQRLLDMSATGTELTVYHVEAAIASVHADASGTESTDWSAIITLYDLLRSMRPSPVVDLNRAIAVAQRDGPERGLQEIRAIDNVERLAAYPFYHAAIGELELKAARSDAACGHFKLALKVARNPMERNFLERRIELCRETSSPLAD